MNFRINKKTINSETINIPSDDICFLGPELVLNDCVVNNRAAAKNLTLSGIIMNGGRFVTKKKLSNFQFRRTLFNDVRFEGIYSGCDFGREDPVGRVDFSKSILDNCRFVGEIDSGSIFPADEHITITNDMIDSFKDKYELFSPDVQLLISILTTDQPQELQFIVSHIPTLAKLLKVNEDEIRILESA